MSAANYKKNKSEKIRAFCALAEQGSLQKASDYLNIAGSAISAYVSSLEKDLKIDLFDRSTKNLLLNEEGKKFYKKAKTILTSMENFFNNDQEDKDVMLEVAKFDSLLERLKRFYVLNKADIFRKIKRYCRKTFKYILLFSISIGIGSGFYLYKTNYFFDKKLYDSASPLLRDLMIGEYHTTEAEDAACSFAVTKFNLDMYDMVLKLTSEKRYKNLSVVSFVAGDIPIIAMRLTGDEKIDKVFESLQYNECNKDGKFSLSAKKAFKDAVMLFERDQNFRFYNLYNKPLGDCLNCNYFVENTKKYPNQLFGIKTEGLPINELARGWIIKRDSYYYLLVMTNILSPEYMVKNSLHVKQKRYISWKKLTERQLKDYNDGLYWQMIKRYNFKF